MTKDQILTEAQFKVFISSIEPPLSEEEYESQCSSFKKLKRNELPYILNIDHLAELTGSSPAQLHLFISDKRKAYSSFKLPKKRGGFRKIDAPSKKMKIVQRWILDNMLYKLDAGKYAHGFVPNRSIATNASVHVGQELVLGIDIKDFFPSITLKRVVGLFQSIGYNEEVSHGMGELCTFNWRLPQGAPTSPMISNLIAWHIDIKLSKFCNKRNLCYSRYADDITISGGTELPRYKTLIFRKIKEEGFSINDEKTRLHGRGSSQRVTGLVVNDTITLGREKKKRLRAIVHNIAKNGPIAENRDNDPFFRERVFGHIGFAKMVEPDFAKSLLESLKNVDWEEYRQISRDSINSELNMRSLSRAGPSPLVKFDELGFFKDVEKLSQKDYTKLLNQLDELQEKCKPHPTKKECRDCLHGVPKESYKKCIKYILGHYIGNTGGTHHGHELYDVGGETDLLGMIVFVGFLAKSAEIKGASGDSLLRQFIDCTELDGLDIISVVTPGDLDHKLEHRLRRVMRKMGEDKQCCMILRTEMIRILYSFQRKQSLNTSE